MAYEIIRIEGAVVYVKISGTMRLADQESLQKAGMGMIGQGVKVRLHVVLENFQGWEKGVDWGDVDFMMAHGNDIEKIALVGDERWKDELFAFVGKGLRTTAIEFFPMTAAAEADRWVRA
ncbi:MAG: STAS/SEC14 domain-containing protein [Syntrophobacteraceae bacterium]